MATVSDEAMEDVTYRIQFPQWIFLYTDRETVQNNQSFHDLRIREASVTEADATIAAGFAVEVNNTLQKYQALFFYGYACKVTNSAITFKTEIDNDAMDTSLQPADKVDGLVATPEHEDAHQANVLSPTTSLHVPFPCWVFLPVAQATFVQIRMGRTIDATILSARIPSVDVYKAGDFEGSDCLLGYNNDASADDIETWKALPHEKGRYIYGYAINVQDAANLLGLKALNDSWNEDYFTKITLFNVPDHPTYSATVSGRMFIRQVIPGSRNWWLENLRSVAVDKFGANLMFPMWICLPTDPETVQSVLATEIWWGVSRECKLMVSPLGAVMVPTTENRIVIGSAAKARNFNDIALLLSIVAFPTDIILVDGTFRTRQESGWSGPGEVAGKYMCYAGDLPLRETTAMRLHADGFSPLE